MKKIKCLFCGLASGLIAIPLMSGMVCCHRVESAKTAKIIAPENHKAVLTNFSSVESTFFSKFSYKGISDPTHITVFNNFVQGLAVFNTSVTNIDFTNQTFDVQITCFDVSKDTLRGNLFFYYDNQIIDDAPTETFTLSVVDSPVISGDIEQSKVVQLDEDGNGDCQFTGFCISDAPDVQNLLKYNVNFSQPGATITNSLVFSDDSHFSLNVHIKSASTGIIASKITFSYKDHILPVADLDQLSIECLGIKSIGAPGQSEYVFDATEKTDQFFTVPYFTFSVVKKDEVEVQVETFDEVTLTAEIVNWNELNSTFDVQIKTDFNNTFINFSFSLVFRDKTTGQLIDYAGKTFDVTTNGVVPKDAFQIEGETGNKTIVGLSAGWEEKIKQLKYTTLRIDNTINKIGDNAFNGKFVGTDSSVTKLEFEKNGYLTSIGNNAFKNNTSLSCDLVIPYYVSSIGDNCFNGCSSLTSLVFENKIAQVSIGEQAFAECSGMKGDLNLPRNVKFTKTKAFRNAGFETLYIANNITSANYPKDNFANLKHVKTIDMVSTTVWPEWLDKSTYNDFNFEGVGSEIEGDDKIVYYNSALSLQALSLPEKFQAHRLSDAFVFWQKN